MTCYQPGRSKTLSGGVVMGFTFSLKMVMKRWSVEGGRKVVLGPQNCFYWGAAAPQTPCCSWGASSPPDPLAGGLQPPVPPCIPRGSASRALRRSWYQDLGTQKNRELERRSLSKIKRGGAGGCRPPAMGSGELEAPQEQQGVWGTAAPQ